MLDPSTERGKFGMDATQGISSASKTNPYQRSLTPVRDTSGFQQDQFIGQNPQGNMGNNFQNHTSFGAPNSFQNQGSFNMSMNPSAQNNLMSGMNNNMMPNQMGANQPSNNIDFNNKSFGAAGGQTQGNIQQNRTQPSGRGIEQGINPTEIANNQITGPK
jgi:hypothetical protein